MQHSSSCVGFCRRRPVWRACFGKRDANLQAGPLGPHRLHRPVDTRWPVRKGRAVCEAAFWPLQ